MRTHFDKVLESLNADLVHMGADVEERMAVLLSAMRERDFGRAEPVAFGDQAVDQMEINIEKRCLQVLVTRQPVAGDLRLVSAMLKMTTDMERIGDQTQDVANLLLCCRGKENQIPLDDLVALGTRAQDMVKKAVDAFVRRDTAAAEAVEAMDDAMDEAFEHMKNALALSLPGRAPQFLRPVLDCLMMAKYFERIADHAVNLAEWTVWAATGEYKGQNL